MRWVIAFIAGAVFPQPVAQVPLGGGLPPIQPIPPFGAPAVRPAPGAGIRPWFRWGFYPFMWQPAYLYPPAAPAIVVISTPAPAREPTPSAPAVERPAARPQVSVYDWPKEEIVREPFFVIALRDSRRLRASAVWIQNGRLHLRTPEGETRRLRAAEIDPELTLKLNREAGLRLNLPPAPEEDEKSGERP